ncbi:MAG: hypothetical protein ACRDGM_14735, partial [bacterium]
NTRIAPDFTSSCVRRSVAVRRLFVPTRLGGHLGRPVRPPRQADTWTRLWRDGGYMGCRSPAQHLSVTTRDGLDGPRQMLWFLRGHAGP